MVWRVKMMNEIIGTDERERNENNEAYWYEQRTHQAGDTSIALRRMFARFLDLYLYKTIWAVILMAVWNVNIGDRAFVWSMMDLYIACGIMLLAEPFLLSRFGTTPGKWILGLSVTSCAGNRLTYGLALSRAWGVFVYGLGLVLPFYDLYRLYKSKVIYSKGEVLYWENESAVVVQPMKIWRVPAYVGMVAVISGVMLLSVCLTVMPDHRGDLTVAEFCENYNALSDYYNIDESYMLNAYGNWEQKAVNGTYVVNIMGDTRPQFQFTTDAADTVTSIFFEADYENETFMIPAYQMEMILAVKAFAGAQEEISLLQNEMEPVLEQIIKHPGESFSFQVHDILITCEAASSGLMWADSLGFFYPEEEENQYHVLFCMQRLPFTATESGYVYHADVEKISMALLSDNMQTVSAEIVQQFAERDAFSSQSPNSWRKKFPTSAEARDYIGYSALRGIDWPLEEKHTELRITGDQSGKLQSLTLETAYQVDDIRLQASALLCTEHDEEACTIETIDPEAIQYQESAVTTEKGRLYHVMTSTARPSGYCTMEAYLVVEGILYHLHIAYLEQDAEPAEALLYQWAEQFD